MIRWDRRYDVHDGLLTQSGDINLGALQRQLGGTSTGLDALEAALLAFVPSTTAAQALSRLQARSGAEEVKTRALIERLLESGWLVPSFEPPVFDRPVFIVAAPRSGSTLLFDLLCQAPELWSIGAEAHHILDPLLEQAFTTPGASSNRATQADASPRRATILKRRLTLELRDRDNRAYLELPGAARPDPVRVLEKTPKNALRIPFLRACFPDARFVFLHRDPRENLASIMEGWESGRFVSHRNLPDSGIRSWSFLLPPGWRALEGKSLAEIAAFQWRASNETVLDDLAEVPRKDWLAVSYAELLAQPRDTLERICRFAGVTADDRLRKAAQSELPLSRTTVSRPDPEKWRRREKEILAVLPTLSGTLSRINRAGNTP
jgi:hypothetical protein